MTLKLKSLVSLLFSTVLTFTLLSKPIVSFSSLETTGFFSKGRASSRDRKMFVQRSTNDCDVSNCKDEEIGSQSKTSRYVSGLSEVSSSYSTFLLDMWGVMHDGTKPYDGVINAVKKLKSEGKRLIILSNSSKRQSNSIKMLTKLGFDTDDFDQIITSGEVSFRMLSGDETLGCTTWGVVSDLIKAGKKKVFVFGSGDGDEEYCNTSGWNLSPIEEADLILARGTFTINNGNSIVCKDDDEKNYFHVMTKSLEIAAAKNIPMLVSNPDRIRPDKDLSPMPGAIGDSYEAVLGDDLGKSLVKRIGKPFPEVYELALGKTSINPSDAIMVGDALETDVIGGTNFQCSTLWVINDGIHKVAISELKSDSGLDSYEAAANSVLETFNAKRGFADENSLIPTYIVPHMRW